MLPLAWFCILIGMNQSSNLFAKAHSVAITPTTRAFAVLTLTEKSMRVVQGKSFKDAGEFVLFQPDSHISHAFTQIQVNIAISRLLRKSTNSSQCAL